MASNSLKEIGFDAGMPFTRGKGNDVKHILRGSNNNEHMISTCLDSSDGRAADMLPVGRGFKTRSKLKL